jgi:hypothetical protein
VGFVPLSRRWYLWDLGERVKIYPDEDLSQLSANRCTPHYCALLSNGQSREARSGIAVFNSSSYITATQTERRKGSHDVPIWAAILLHSAIERMAPYIARNVVDRLGTAGATLSLLR